MDTMCQQKGIVVTVLEKSEVYRIKPVSFCNHCCYIHTPGGGQPPPPTFTPMLYVGVVEGPECDAHAHGTVHPGIGAEETYISSK